MKKILFFAAAAVAMLTGCSQNDDLTAPKVAQNQEQTPVEFGTYMGRQAQTRAGWAGDITIDQLKSSSAAKGFGVFAFYTGTQTYNDKNGTSATLAPNFMYNEHIYWNTTPGEWKYDNTKYWPNEVQSGDVDMNDNPDEATTSHTNGGKLTFFAYAPYVNATVGTGAVSPNTEGITALTSNAATGDPKITYLFNKTGKNVDLLWGTYGSTSASVVGGTLNQGVKTTATTVSPRPVASRTSWPVDILSDVATTPTKYTMNADLVKQENDGTVDFAFKHALSMVGGSSTIATNTPGLGIVLDADAITAADAAANTVVSVEDIKITTLPMAYLDDNATAKTGDDARYITGGQFNLATGKWTVTTSDDAANKVVHELTTSGTGVSGTLNADIAEPTTVSNMNEVDSKRTLNGTIKGVTGTVKPVYGSETSPLLFIPGCKPKFEIEITYYVRSFDEKLASATPGATKTGETGTWTNVKQTIKKTVEFANYTELNKRYALLIHLGITSVKFTATVSDWDTNDKDGSGTSTSDDYETVALPLNVN